MRLKVYFGKVCAKHPELKGERNLASRSCVACNIERTRGWRKDNAALKRAANIKWCATNKEYQRRRSREWHAQNLDYHAKRCRDLRLEKKEQQCAI